MSPSGRGDAPPVLGMVGAGQLARMTHQSVIGLAVQLRVLGGGPIDSAAQVTPDAVVGSWDDLEQLEAFASGCDVVTFDHELVDPRLLATLAERGHVLRPGPAAQRYAQDKLHQRQQLAAAGFPVPDHRAVTSRDDLLGFGDAVGWPVVAKAVRGGYDGRGVWMLPDADAAQRLWDETSAAGSELLVEEHVPIVRELAVAVVRRPAGEQRTYAVTETVQSDGICVELVVPAPAPPVGAAVATALAERVVRHIDGVGVVALELFQTADSLVVNELALRPHNSVHWTIEGARTSQFQNHARAVLDLPLGDTALTAPAVATVNVLGPADGSDPRVRLPAALEVPGATVHLYGKAARPGRKLGHVTTVGDDPTETRLRARRAADLLTGEGDQR
ncbi:MAG: 5-(carboxyamino)imidazole ribonucleotide synthase [Nitriliruptor sp.]